MINEQTAVYNKLIDKLHNHKIDNYIEIDAPLSIELDEMKKRIYEKKFKPNYDLNKLTERRFVLENNPSLIDNLSKAEAEKMFSFFGDLLENKSRRLN